MWKVSYLNLENNQIELKGEFKSDKEAIEWVENNKDKIVALKLLVWSEYLQCCRVVLDFTKS